MPRFARTLPSLALLCRRSAPRSRASAWHCCPAPKLGFVAPCRNCTLRCFAMPEQTSATQSHRCAPRCSAVAARGQASPWLPVAVPNLRHELPSIASHTRRSAMIITAVLRRNVAVQCDAVATLRKAVPLLCPAKLHLCEAQRCAAVPSPSIEERARCGTVPCHGKAGHRLAATPRRG